MAALELTEELAADAQARIGEKQGDVAARIGRSTRPGCLGSVADITAARRTSPASPTCTARSAPLWDKGDSRRASIDNYQRGIDSLKDGEPCIELVRLYEEAASLYMRTRATTCSPSTSRRR